MKKAPAPSRTRSTSTARRRAAVLGGSALLLPVLLAACGGDDETAAAAEDCGSTEKVTIMMGTSDMDISYAPYASLADELGYFAEECLDVTVTTTGGSTTTAQAVMSGVADIAIQTPDSMIAAANTERLPIKIFHNLLPRSSYEIAVKPGAGVAGDADLAGKVVGFPMISDSIVGYLSTRMKEAGTDAKTVKQVATGFGATSAESLQKGEIDAFVGWPGMWAAFENAGYEFDILPAPEWQNDYYGIGLGATDEYIEANPEVVEGVSRAVARSTVFLKENPDAAVKLFWEEYPERAPLPGDDEDKAFDDTRAVLQATIDTMRLDDFEIDHTWGVQDAEAWVGQIEYNRQVGLVTQELDPADFFTDQFNEAANDFDRAEVVERAEEGA